MTIHLQRSGWTWLLPAVIGLCLVACGGGGSGGTPPPAGGGGSGGQGPPPAPIVDYNGQTSQAVVAADNADAFASTLLRGIDEFLEISDLIIDSPLSPGIIDQQLSGGNGTATLTGNIASDGRGWIAARYQDFLVDGLVLNGLEVQTIAEPITAAGGRVSIAFHDLRVLSAQRNYRLQGSLTRQLVDGPAGSIQLQGDFMFTEAGQAPLRAGPFSISIQPADDIPAGLVVTELQVGGRVYVPDAGYLNIQVREPLHFDGYSVSPGATPFSGELSLTGIQGSRLVMTSLNSHFGALVLEQDSAGQSGTLHKRFDWDPSATVHPGNGALMLAGAGPDRFTRLQQTVMLDGRFAVHRNDQYLRHQWRMISAPPGASSSITAADQPVGSFVASHFGTYLVEHEVSDGQSSATDQVRIFVVDDSIVPEDFNLAVNVGPDLSMRSSDSIQLDARRTVTPFGRPVTRPGWTEFLARDVGRPSAQYVVFEDRDTLLPRVSIDVPGYYEITHTAETFAPPTFGGDMQALYVDYPWRLRKPAHIFSQSGTPLIPEYFLAEDLTGNGAVDLAASVRGGNLGEHQLLLYTSFGGGALNAPFIRHYTIPETIETLTMPLLAAGPANIEGLRDIYVAHGDHVRVFELQSDWSLQDGGSIATTLQQAGHVSEGLKFVDFSAAGRSGLIRITGSSQGGIEVFLRTDDGSLESPLVVSKPDIIQVAYGDLDGDGHVDLAVVSQALGEQPLLSIGYGNGAGGFSFDASLPWNSGHVAVGDLDGDGKDDIVTATSDTELLALYQQEDRSLEAAEIPVAGLPISMRLDLVDFDGDGMLDIVCHRPGLTTLVRQATRGTFAPAVELPVTPGGGRVDRSRRVWIDFDGSGHVDLVAVDSAGNRDSSGFREARGLFFVLQAPAEFD